MALSVDLTLTNLLIVVGIYFALKRGVNLFIKWRLNQMIGKYKDSPKDIVILHTIWRCKPLPSLSPFAIKLETYLRMAKIPYELETKDIRGPKDKLPWITLNGESLADSQLIIQFLNKKFSVDLNHNSSSEQVAIAKACRIVLEDHFLWGIVQFRWIENPSALHTLLKMPIVLAKLTSPIFSYTMKKRMYDQGMGRHTPAEIYQLTEEDLWSLSTILGNKKFFGGETACEEDCGIFGGISQALWGTPGSSFQKLLNDELTNLKQYAERMRELYWPDWEQCVDKSN